MIILFILGAIVALSILASIVWFDLVLWAEEAGGGIGNDFTD